MVCCGQFDYTSNVPAPKFVQDPTVFPTANSSARSGSRRRYSHPILSSPCRSSKSYFSRVNRTQLMSNGSYDDESSFVVESPSIATTSLETETLDFNCITLRSPSLTSSVSEPENVFSFGDSEEESVSEIASEPRTPSPSAAAAVDRPQILIENGFHNGEVNHEDEKSPQKSDGSFDTLKSFDVSSLTLKSPMLERSSAVVREQFDLEPIHSDDSEETPSSQHTHPYDDETIPDFLLLPDESGYAECCSPSSAIRIQSSSSVTATAAAFHHALSLSPANVNSVSPFLNGHHFHADISAETDEFVCKSPEKSSHIDHEHLKSIEEVEDESTDALSAQDTKSILSPERKKQRSPKSVRFADSVGQALSQVKVFDANQELLDQLKKAALVQSEETAKPVTQQSYKFEFTQPASDYLAFRRKLEEKCVSLENVYFQNSDRMCGTVKVKNIAFDKKVWVRLTFNSWATTTDINCTYVDNGLQTTNLYDTFKFEVMVPPTWNSYHKIQFCVAYSANGTEFWDNNNGVNYLVTSNSRDAQFSVPFQSRQAPERTTLFSYWRADLSSPENTPYW